MKAIAPAEAFPRARAAAAPRARARRSAAGGARLARIGPRVLGVGLGGLGERVPPRDRRSPRATRWRTAGTAISSRASGATRRRSPELRLALELDLLSLVTLAAIGSASFYARRYEEAIAHYRHALDIEPDSCAGARRPRARAGVLRAHGRGRAGVRARARLAGTPMTSHSAGLANALALSGRVGEAREMLAALTRRRAESYISLWALASIHARLGETEEALDWLERAYEEHDSTLVWLKVHPRFDALRREPRFEALLARLRL